MRNTLLALLLLLACSTAFAIVDDTEPASIAASSGALDNFGREVRSPAVHVAVGVQPSLDCAFATGERDLLACALIRDLTLSGQESQISTGTCIDLEAGERACTFEALRGSGFKPLNACDNGLDCGKAIQSACKALGWTQPGGVTTYQLKWAIGPGGQKWSDCSGTCPNGKYMFVTCSTPK